MDISTNAAEATYPLATYNLKSLAWSIAFIFAATLFPAIFAHTPQNQWLTGTIVNAILFLAVWRVGVVNASFAAFLPSSIALMRGLLPAPMAVLVPYIILSNLIMIAIFFATKKRPILGILSASIAKFAFLLAVASFFAKSIGPFIVMMQWPQLATALAGGLIAVGAMQMASKKKSFKNI